MRHGSKTAAGDPNFDMSVRVLRQSVGLCNGPPSLNLRLARDWLTKLWFFSQKDPRRRIFPTIFLYALRWLKQAPRDKNTRKTSGSMFFFVLLSIHEAVQQHSPHPRLLAKVLHDNIRSSKRICLWRTQSSTPSGTEHL